MKRKGLRFLVDLGVGKKVQGWLRDQGCDVLCVRDIDPRATDSEILRLAASDQRIVVTMDKDFGALVYRRRMAQAGVLLLRLEDAAGDEKAQVVSEILRKHSEKLPGNFCVYQRGKLRVRRMPKTMRARSREQRGDADQ